MLEILKYFWYHFNKWNEPSEPREPVFCINCKYCIGEDSKAKCNHPYIRDEVTGGPTFCFIARLNPISNEPCCGSDAQLYVPKENIDAKKI